MIIEAVLNRLRGTGVVKHFGTIRIGEYSIEVKLVWNHIYAMYLGVIVGVIAGTLAGVCVAVAYLIGESKGWGEWIGALTTTKIKDEKWLQKQYDDDEGKKFPYIHQIANMVVAEKCEGELYERVYQYDRYATVALALRGMYWWGLVYGVMAWFEVVGWVTAVVGTVVIGLMFPVACWIGKKVSYEKTIGVLKFKQGWENQEVAYGLMQGIVFWIMILTEMSNG